MLGRVVKKESIWGQRGQRVSSWGMLGLGLSLMVLLALTSGCYPDWPEHSGTAQVEGEVFLDGFPLNHATVVFLPTKLKSTSGKIMPVVYGKTDARGMFKLKYRDGSRDLMAGKYVVLISLIESKSDPSDDKPVEKPDDKPDELAAGSPSEPAESFDETHASSLQLVHRMIADTQSGPVSRAQLIEQIDRDQVVPALYNRESNLKYEIVASPGILRTKFELSSVDPLLK